MPFPLFHHARQLTTIKTKATPYENITPTLMLDFNCMDCVLF